MHPFWATFATEGTKNTNRVLQLQGSSPLAPLSYALGAFLQPLRGPRSDETDMPPLYRRPGAWPGRWPSGSYRDLVTPAVSANLPGPSVPSQPNAVPATNQDTTSPGALAPKSPSGDRHTRHLLEASFPNREALPEPIAPMEPWGNEIGTASWWSVHEDDASSWDSVDEIFKFSDKDW